MLNRKNLLAVAFALIAVAIFGFAAYQSDMRPGGPKDRMDALREEQVVYEGIPTDQVSDSIPDADDATTRAAPLPQAPPAN